MGAMADPHELLRATKAIGAIDRMPTPGEAAELERDASGQQLWRLQVAHHLAGAVEAQVLMAGCVCRFRERVGTCAVGRVGVLPWSERRR